MVIVAARPFLIGSDAWVRSRACTDDFSSRHNTIAPCRGSRYSPTTSISFSSNRGSLDSLNEWTRCGFRPRAAQTRCTVAAETPTRLAIVRELHCVCPAGLLLRVNSTISSIFDCGMLDLRPRPARTLPSLASPSASKRQRHDRTVAGQTPNLRGDPRVSDPVRGQQQHPRPLHLAKRCRTRLRDHLQRLTLALGHHQSSGRRHHSQSLPPKTLAIMETHH